MAQRHKGAVVIGADSIAVIEGKVVGKAKDENEAREFLNQLSGSSCLAITGLAIIDANGTEYTEAVETKLYFRELSEKEINKYIATGEPMTCAGGIAIQGGAATMISRIEGDFYNVVGLPISRVAEILNKTEREKLISLDECIDLLNARSALLGNINLTRSNLNI